MSEPNATVSRVELVSDFDSLFESHHEAVFRYCVRRLGLSEADDAAADVFAIIWRRLDQVPTGEATRAFLIGVAYKVVGNRYRSRRRQARLSERLRFDRSSRRSVDSSAGDHDSHPVLVAMERLSRTDQELIRLESWDGLSRSQIGDILGIRANAVDQRLHRARARLKSHLEDLAASSQESKPEEAAI